MESEGMSARRKFSREFKLEVVKLVRDRGVAMAQAARYLGLRINVLRKWVSDLGADPDRAFPGHGQMRPEQLEIERLRRENAKLKAERDILKSRGLFREALEMKFSFIAKHRGVWPVSWVCEALSVSRSGFHCWLGRAPSARPRSDEMLGARVRASFISSYRTYGARRVWHDVLAEGQPCAPPSIERLMRQQALKAQPRRRGLSKDDGQRSVIAEKVLDRQFSAEAPNQKWVADFTYIWPAEGWLYVAAVIDLFSRRVVGWSMSATMTAQLVTRVLMMAIWRRGKPDALLHHSDQGRHYTGEQFQGLMADNGVTCSMSRLGNVWDSVAMESFFSSLKAERIASKTYRTRNHAKAEGFDYIERFYKPTRSHSTLWYLSPIDFERQSNVV
jgi:putative transposase